MFASKVREVHLALHPRLLLQRQRVPVRLRLPLTRRSTRPLRRYRRKSTRYESTYFLLHRSSKTAWLSHAPGTIRTCDLCLRRAALYPLSYGREGSDSVAALSCGEAGARRDRDRAAASCATRRSSEADRYAERPRRTPRARAGDGPCRPPATAARAGSSRAADSRRADTGRSTASGSAPAGSPTTTPAQAVAWARARRASAGTSVRTYASATTEPSARRAALVTRPTALPSCTSSAS